VVPPQDGGADDLRRLEVAGDHLRGGDQLGIGPGLDDDPE
jgi:hypothetical protein